MKTLPDHPFYRGFQLEWLGEYEFTVVRDNLRINCVKGEDGVWHWDVGPRARMIARTDGGAVDEAVVAMKGITEDLEGMTERAKAVSESLPTSLEARANQILSQIRGLPPALLGEFKRALNNYNQKTKEWAAPTKEVANA